MNRPNRTEVIQRFLKASTHPDLANLYTKDMECQVNVAKDNGTRVDGEYKGVPWQAWTDGDTQWKSFRIPFNAATEPEFEDRPLNFDLAAHAEGIGMTGWDFVAKVSRWVGFDFDSIAGHAERHTKKLTAEELQRVQEIASSIPWVMVRKSTSGKGRHLYMFLEPGVTTRNHTEHAAVGRAMLGKLSAITGFDFGGKVDLSGGNMWVWHRKMQGSEGLELIKSHTELATVPANWRDHIRVVQGKKRRMVAPKADDTADTDEDLFDTLASQHPRTPLDDQHRKLLAWILDPVNLKTKQAWWDQDRHMLICHTTTLLEAHTALSLRGVFRTDTRESSEQNAFAFPLRHGAWVVRRYGLGVGEAVTWGQDGQGYTRCFLNRDPDLATAAKSYEGIEDEKKVFHFKDLTAGLEAAGLLGISTNILNDFPDSGRRPAWIKQMAENRIMISFERKDSDVCNAKDWLPKKNLWLRIFDVRQTADEGAVAEGTGAYDDLLRHISNDFEDQGWSIRDEDGQWKTHPLSHVKPFLQSQGLNANEAAITIGRSISKSWTLVNMPFREEYPGNRKWNRGAAQLAFVPSQNEVLKYPHWLMILKHLGRTLDEAVVMDRWCKDNAILTGEDYLKAWIAAMFQFPLEPLPYLFFWSTEQNTGKSMFYEALSMLMTKGFVRAESALSNQQGFNGELASAILCATDEFDLSGVKNIAYNRIKDWVTSRELPIHFKNKTPYQIANSTHWVQMGNNREFCPTFPGDTRIVHIRVLGLEEEIPKMRMLEHLRAEAPDFLAAVMRVELPPPAGRLYIPVIETADKTEAMNLNRDPVQVFLSENCFHVPGALIKYDELWELFKSRTDPNEVTNWTKQRFGKKLPHEYPKGRLARENGQIYIGNIATTKDTPATTLLVGYRHPDGEIWLEPTKVAK